MLHHMPTTSVAHRSRFKPRQAKLATQADPLAQVEPQWADLGAVPVTGPFSRIRGLVQGLEFCLFWQSAIAKPIIYLFRYQAD